MQGAAARNSGQPRPSMLTPDCANKRTSGSCPCAIMCQEQPHPAGSSTSLTCLSRLAASSCEPQLRWYECSASAACCSRSISAGNSPSSRLQPSTSSPPHCCSASCSLPARLPGGCQAVGTARPAARCARVARLLTSTAAVAVLSSCTSLLFCWACSVPATMGDGGWRSTSSSRSASSSAAASCASGGASPALGCSCSACATRAASAAAAR